MNTNLSVKLLLFLASSPFFFLAIHIFFSRRVKSLSPQIVACLAILFSQAVLAILIKAFVLQNQLLTHGELVSLWVYSATVLLSFGYAYFHFFNTSETARRIRILHEIQDHGTLTEPDIRKLYDGGDIINVRLHRLLELKQLSCKGGRYYLKGRQLYCSAVAIAFWRELCGIKPAPK
jgi:hypothetical protein